MIAAILACANHPPHTYPDDKIKPEGDHTWTFITLPAGSHGMLIICVTRRYTKQIWTGAEADAWCELSDRRRKFNDRYCAKLLAAGWKFGGSVINVVRCPCCPHNAQVDQERAEIKAALVELFGDDEDGLAAAFEDHQL